MRWLLVGAVALAAAACGGAETEAGPGGTADGGAGGEVADGGDGAGGGIPTEAPVIERLEPDHGVPGTQVTLIGRNFSPRLLDHRIQFGGVESATLAVSEDLTALRTAVPIGAATGPLRMVVSRPNGLLTVEGPVFTVDPRPAPVLTSITLDPAAPLTTELDTTLTARGSELYPDSTIFVGDLELDTRYTNETTLTAAIPANTLAPGEYRVRVETPGPGGGASVTRSLEVVNGFNLLSAEATDASTIVLTFDQFASATGARVSVSGRRQVTAVDQTGVNGDQLRVTVGRRTPLSSGTQYTVTVSAARSRTGGFILENRAQFTYR